jgi:serum/glucocorticoid-regulated kinase 2
LGALLYELVTGLPPYYSTNQEEIYENIVNSEITFPSNVYLSIEIKNLLKGLLEKNPTKRLGSLYGIKEILIHPWIGKINIKTI